MIIFLNLFLYNRKRMLGNAGRISKNIFNIGMYLLMQGMLCRGIRNRN